MMNFPSERSIYEHWSELLREAETCRRLKQSQAEGKPHRGAVARLLAWLGGRGPESAESAPFWDASTKAAVL
jgi:hypothetical protein